MRLNLSKCPVCSADLIKTEYNDFRDTVLTYTCGCKALYITKNPKLWHYQKMCPKK
jgi:hypothetical protein